MAASALQRIPDTLPSFHQELDRLEQGSETTANDNRLAGRLGQRLTPLGARLERSVRALRHGGFETSERALRADLEMLETLAASAATPDERRAATRREALTRRLLAAARLEQLDTAGAEALYAGGYAALKDDTPDMRWEYAHAVATHLESMAAATGLAEMARAAVTYARAAVETAVNPGDAWNLLGRTLIAVGTREADTASLEQALAAFEAALQEETAFEAALQEETAFEAALRAEGREGEGRDRPEPSRLTRIRVNLAATLRLLGEREGDPEKTRQAVAMLRDVLAETPPPSVSDWPRAQDALGNALADLDRHEEAIAAYKAALDTWPDAAERARSLSNLGTVLLRANRFEEAHAAHEAALSLLSPDRQPLAWARVKSNQADLLSEQGTARAASEPALAKSCLLRAVHAYEAALEKRPRAWSPLGWAVTTADLAATIAMLGELERSDPESHDDAAQKRETLAYLQRAVTLCVEALPDLTGPDRVRAQAILTVTLLPLARNASGDRDRGLAVNACASLLAAIEAEEFGGLRDGVVEVLRSVGEGLSGEPADAASAATPPPEVAWPTERYSASPEAKKGGGGIVAFLERVWREPIETQGVDLRTLRGVDPAAAMAVSNLRRTGKTLPAHLVIPTLAEKHDKEALIFQDPGQRPARLDWALRRRAWRAGKKSAL